MGSPVACQYIAFARDRGNRLCIRITAPGRNRVKRRACGRNKGLQIGQTIGWGAKNYDRNPPPLEILLKRDLLIRGHRHLKARVFRGG
jgi:hypothetical protein